MDNIWKDEAGSKIPDEILEELRLKWPVLEEWPNTFTMPFRGENYEEYKRRVLFEEKAWEALVVNGVKEEASGINVRRR